MSHVCRVLCVVWGIGEEGGKEDSRIIMFRKEVAIWIAGCVVPALKFVVGQDYSTISCLEEIEY